MSEEKEDFSTGKFLHDLNTRMRKSLFLKLCLIGVILLFCQIPMLMVSSLTDSRSNLADSVAAEVASKWGNAQHIAGPLLAIPLRREWSEKLKDGSTRQSSERATMYVVPKTLKVIGTMQPETRYRGIYEVILYRSQLEIKGVFDQDISLSGDWVADYSNAKICLGITDMIGLSNIKIEANCSENKAYPGINASSAPINSGISIPVKLPADGKMPDGGLNFKASFSLNGCRTLQIVPIGKDTSIELSSPWNTPSFDGDFLPADRKIDDNGFQATWKINEFNRNISQTWIARGSKSDIDLPTAGVSLIKQANIYSQVTRAATYSILIFLIVLIAFLIAERLTNVWMHPLQYCLAAASLVLFYALTLALSEHIAFNVAYWVSVAAITGLCAFYCTMIFRKLGAVVGMCIAMLASYGVIFVLLKLEDYALLAGALVML
ncbi:MAG: cell envelope integrity protein CreD, partial [Victivallales bacterium]|nr:cell envelope integrity protein CreD [Victivallales bacterium]